MVAEALGRRWVSFEERLEYVASSSFRFLSLINTVNVRKVYEEILSGRHVDIAY